MRPARRGSGALDTRTPAAGSGSSAATDLGIARTADITSRRGSGSTPATRVGELSFAAPRVYSPGTTRIALPAASPPDCTSGPAENPAEREAVGGGKSEAAAGLSPTMARV